MGLTVSLDDVLSQANGSPLGRPHIAAAMVENGLVADKDEAFSRYIGDRGPAFQPKPYAAAQDLIALIHRTGGRSSTRPPQHQSSRVHYRAVSRLRTRRH